MNGIRGSVDELVAIFHKYSHKDGDAETLSKVEMKTMIEREFKVFLKDNSKVTASLNEVFIKLDATKDGKLNFTEYMTLILLIAVAVHAGV